MSILNPTMNFVATLEHMAKHYPDSLKANGIWAPASLFSSSEADLLEDRRVTNWGKLTIERKTVSFLMKKLGREAYNYTYMSGNRNPHLHSLFEAAKDKYCPEMSAGTVRLWFQHYLQFGLTPEEMRREKRKAKVGTKGLSFTDEDKAALDEIIREEPELYLDEIQDRMQEKRNKIWAPSTLWRQLKRQNYSLQVCTFRAIEQSLHERMSYKGRLDLMVKHPRQVVFLDESHKSANAARRRRCWSPKGITPRRPEYFTAANGKRYTLIAACDYNGFIAEACQMVEREHGDSDQDLSRGTVDGERFEMWVENMLVPVLGNYERGEARSIVVLDNASVHHSDRVVRLIEEAGAVVIYTAPYTPELNPIEYMFRQYKSFLRRHHDMDWVILNTLALRTVTPADAKALFRHCEVPGCQHYGKESRSRSRALIIALSNQNKMVAAGAALYQSHST